MSISPASSLAQTLGIKPSDDVRLVAAPDGFAEALSPLPENASVIQGATDGRRFPIQVVFAKQRSDLTHRLGDALLALPSDGMVWIAWPRASAGVSTDLTHDQVREVGLMAGLVDVKECAIDDDWSGLKFVVRVQDRPQWPHRANVTT